MKKILTLTTFTMLGACASKPAAPVATGPCHSVRSCIDLVSRVSGQNYVINEHLAEGHQVHLSENTAITKENADLFLTNILISNDLARVPTGQPNSYYIVEIKNAIQSPVPTFDASLNQTPNLPNTFDIISLKYKMVDAAAADEFQRFLVDLVPRYGRVSSYPGTGILMITDSAPNVKRVIEVLHSIDKPMSAQLKKELAERRAARMKQMQNTPPPKSST
ncbi:MAG: hypothetical protein JST16_18205 [Bdellovibrionales bacterium]|nr:hypothetical protein [Bdellovibrionales bacterium]